MTDFALFQNEYLKFIIILLLAIIIAKIASIFLKKCIRLLLAIIKIEIDDLLLKNIETPLYTAIIFLGFYLALMSLSALNKYAQLINSLFFIILVLFVTLFVSRVSYVFITKWLRVKKKLRQIPRIITLIYNIILYLIALMIILDHFQIKLTLLIATLGISGLAFGLAMQNALSNFFAGLYLISDKPIKVGDFIEIEKGPSGFVEDIGWRSTRIKTLSNTIIIVPNSKLAESIVINNSLPDNEIYVLIECGVSSKSDLKKVEKITNEVAKKIQRTVPGAVKNFEPFMRYHTFGDSKINFTVKLRAEKFKDRYLIIHEFIKALKERFDEEKIEIC